MEQKPKCRVLFLWPFIGLILIIILLVLTIAITGRKDATNLENGLVQVIAFACSTVIAVGIGFVSAKEQAQEIVRPHGRKAVRRIVTLGRGIRAIGATIETEQQRMEHHAEREGQIDAFEVQATFKVLTSQVTGQLRVVEDAIEDWRDVVPEEIAAIEDPSPGDKSDGN